MGCGQSYNIYEARNIHLQCENMTLEEMAVFRSSLPFSERKYVTELMEVDFSEMSIAMNEMHEVYELMHEHINHLSHEDAMVKLKELRKSVPSHKQYHIDHILKLYRSY